jgi:hypothetical protein
MSFVNYLNKSIDKSRIRRGDHKNNRYVMGYIVKVNADYFDQLNKEILEEGGDFSDCTQSNLNTKEYKEYCHSYLKDGHLPRFILDNIEGEIAEELPELLAKNYIFVPYTVSGWEPAIDDNGSSFYVFDNLKPLTDSEILFYWDKINKILLRHGLDHQFEKTVFYEFMD